MEIASVHDVQAALRGRRLELGRTQADVAGAAGVSRKWLSDFERGATTAVELPIVLRVSAALGLALHVQPTRSADASATTPADDAPANPSDGIDLDAVLDDYRQRGRG